MVGTVGPCQMSFIRQTLGAGSVVVGSGNDEVDFDSE